MIGCSRGRWKRILWGVIGGEVEDVDLEEQT